MNRKLKNEELNRINIDDFISLKKLPVVVVLDDIRSLNNIGSIFRTCDAFLVEKIYLCGITAQPPHREIQKTALGATESVAWEYFSSVTDCILMLKKEGFRILSIEQAEEKTFLHQLNFQQDMKCAIIFGNEVNGVSQKVIDLSDLVVEIPQFGTKHSLNVSVSAGIVLWEIIRKIPGSS